LEEAGTDNLKEEDIVVIAYITAKVNNHLQNIRKNFLNPKDFAQRALKLTEHKHNMTACNILFNLKNLDPDKLYKPEQFREMVTNTMQTQAVNISRDIVTALENDAQYGRVNYKDMNRALEELESEIGLINIKGKRNIKKVRGKQRIKFSGSPSVYKLLLMLQF
jgi:hypothetical protein